MFVFYNGLFVFYYFMKGILWNFIQTPNNYYEHIKEKA